VFLIDKSSGLPTRAARPAARGSDPRDPAQATIAHVPPFVNWRTAPMLAGGLPDHRVIATGARTAGRPQTGACAHAGLADVPKRPPVGEQRRAGVGR